MRNKYEINGEVTTIIIESRTYGRIETLIDTEDLEKAKQATSWAVMYDKHIKSFYVRGSIKDKEGNIKRALLHRHLMNVTDRSLQVDHIRHNSLDNRKSMLRIVTNAENHQNRRLSTDNVSGVAGVFYDKGCGKWRGRIQVGGVYKYLGNYESKSEAISARKAAEKKYFTYRQSIA